MNQKKVILIGVFAILILIIFITVLSKFMFQTKSQKLTGTVMKYEDNMVTVQDQNLGIYTFRVKDVDFDIGDHIVIEYSGVLDRNHDHQDCKVQNYKLASKTDENGIPIEWKDSSIFHDYYNQAYQKLKTLTLEEKIGQLLLVRYPDFNQIEILKKYHLGGFVFYEKDFKNKTENEVIHMIETLQGVADIPLLTAVDEEGGKVIRVSSNPNLVKVPFQSPSELYKSGGFSKIKEDTIQKSRILYHLGLNLNLAPVVDVSTDPSDYIYERTLQQNSSLTETYAKTVIEASKDTGVSYTLKHFPGYGNNTDTHTGVSVDNRSYQEILDHDLPPFQAGINAQAEAILVSHNIVNSIDNTNPASLSVSVHNLLRNELKFSGIVITDDISMSAVNNIDDISVKAILAGNDLIITTDYEESFNEIKNAVKDGTISEEQINKLAFKILSWKYYKLLLTDNLK